MFVDDELDPSNVCRDENCDRVDVHRKHLIAKHRPPKPHHRPKTTKPLWLSHDPKALTGAVARATSKAYPTVFTEIVHRVHNDYGSCTERTIYRHLAKLIERGQLIKLDLGLTFAAYIRPRSRLLDSTGAPKDFQALREHVVSEYHPGRMRPETSFA